MMSGESTSRVDFTLFSQIIINSLALLFGLVGIVTFLYGVNKKWGLFDCCRRKSTKSLKDEELEKERLASILNAEELWEIREELRKHIDALKFKLAEVAE